MKGLWVRVIEVSDHVGGAWLQFWSGRGGQGALKCSPGPQPPQRWRGVRRGGGVNAILDPKPPLRWQEPLPMGPWQDNGHRRRQQGCSRLGGERR